MIRILLSLALLLSQCCSVPQSTGAIAASGGGGNTWTLVQEADYHTQNSAYCTTSPCVLTVASTGANNVLVVAAFGSSASGDYITAASGGGTYTIPAACQVGAGAIGSVSCAYVTASSSGVTSVSVSVTGLGSFGNVYFWEWKPSTGSATYDTASTVNDAVASTTPAGVGLTLTGTSDVIMQVLAQVTGNPTAISSPYTIETSGAFFAGAYATNQSSGSAPTWTASTSATAVGLAIAFK